LISFNFAFKILKKIPSDKISFSGYLTILARQVMCAEFSQCYNNVNICLWTDGSQLTQSAAQSACQQRNSFLPRITNSNIQSKLREFRSAAGNLLAYEGIWIDVKAVGINNFHWIDGSSLAGHLIFFVYARIYCGPIIISKL